MPKVIKRQTKTSKVSKVSTKTPAKKQKDKKHPERSSVTRKRLAKYEGTTDWKSFIEGAKLLSKPEYDDQYLVMNGDSVEVLNSFKDNSVGLSIFSPPFSSLYTYTATERDLGNCRDDVEFMEHFKYISDNLFRITMKGRLVCVHCMNIPSLKSRDGYIGIKDFRGDLIRLFQSSGFIFHSEVCIWKNPVVAMVRTHAKGLLHKQLVKDSSHSRMGIPDYLLTFRKPGDNPEPIEGEFLYYNGTDEFEPQNLSIDTWQRYASPVWMDIREGDTLRYVDARDEEDEKHICPLQLPVIERCLQLWSNPGDVVLSPFMGIGSEGWESLRLGRRFVGIELKESYYKIAAKNLKFIAERDVDSD